MTKPISLSLIALAICITSCNTKVEQKNSNADPKAQEVVDLAIEKHGGDAYASLAVGFDFRDRHYTVRRQPDKFVYTRSWADDSLGQVEDILVNSSELTRLVNGDTVTLSDEWSFKYANSVNSVLYFMQLPYGLNDAAVKKKYLGEETIKGKPYDKIEITFEQEGGGKDYEDIFVYWFDLTTHQLDYFAYYYNTDETGIRFREAYNRQVIDGITFQDYVNYMPVDSTATVYEQAALFEQLKLKELSKIENERLESLK